MLKGHARPKIFEADMGSMVVLGFKITKFCLKGPTRQTIIFFSFGYTFRVKKHKNMYQCPNLK